ncbi:MAG: HK97 family phage prohead protease [Bacteroidaceae bacterium]|nr:HK97 family phage prohead protease [Bacteroidaceae bacterium]
MPKLKNRNTELVTRAYTAEFRASEDENERGVIEGTPIVFNQDTKIQDWAGEYMERIDPHALDDADLRDVCLFVNHDTGKIPLARSKNGRGTLNFTIDDVGLHMKSVLDIDNNSEARALHSAVGRGDISGMSFMFRISEQDWQGLDTDMPTRIVRKISIVHEVSAVNFPAYPQTSINARSSEETEYSPLAEARKALSEETEKKSSGQLEIEKLKNEIRMKF